MIWKAQHKKEMAGLDTAAGILAGLEHQRAGSGRVAFAQALLLDIKGDGPEALQKYRKAVEYGENSPQALKRLLELLWAYNHVDEAAAVLQKLPKTLAAGSEIERIAADVSLRTANLADAVAHADRAIGTQSKEPRDYIWQGRVYFAAGQKTKAETAFRKAAALRPEAPDGWLVLLQFLAATSRREEAIKLLDEAKPKIPQTSRTLFLRRGVRLIGNKDQAIKEFERARTERPSDLPTLQSEAEYLFNAGELAKAVEAFKRVIDLSSASAREKDLARQMVALCLATDRDYDSKRKALVSLGLLAGNRLQPLTGNETPVQLQTRIYALALQPDRESRLAAIRLLEGSKEELSANNRFLLAQLYLAVGDQPKVRLVMDPLVKKHNRVALYVGFYATWLLRSGDIKEGEVWVKQLSELQPDAFSTAELQARLAGAKGDIAAARTILLAGREGRCTAFAHCPDFRELEAVQRRRTGLPADS